MFYISLLIITKYLWIPWRISMYPKLRMPSLIHRSLFKIQETKACILHVVVCVCVCVCIHICKGFIQKDWWLPFSLVSLRFVLFLNWHVSDTWQAKRKWKIKVPSAHETHGPAEKMRYTQQKVKCLTSTCWLLNNMSKQVEIV